MCPQHSTPFIDLNYELPNHWGIEPPDFPFLFPDSNSYQIMHYQPEGVIEVRNNFIGNKDRGSARQQYKKFIDLACELNTDIVITPEYSCPLEVLQESLLEGQCPINGKLWIIGCESITITQLYTFRNSMRDRFKVCYEEEIETSSGDFIDPVFYIFRAKDSEQIDRIIILIQFKNEPMGDGSRFEHDHMKRGKKIYIFNKYRIDRIRLLTLICSDALSTHLGSQDTLQEIYGRSIIVHIQLNPNPRSETFKLYRNLCFTRFSDNDTEIFCVNWSKNVNSDPLNAIRWGNYCGSALYIKPQNFNHIERNDQRINNNHIKGLYITYCDDFKAYCFYFNFVSGIYYYRTSKPWQRNAVPQQAIRNGPEMLGNYFWNIESQNWILSMDPLDDEFRRVCCDINESYLNFLYNPHYDPLNIERLITLSSGGSTEDLWHQIKNMPSCRIPLEETISKFTFAQDPDAEAIQKRHMKIGLFCRLHEIIQRRNPWPIWLNSFSNYSELTYKPERPHLNLHDQNNATTVIFAGIHPGEAMLQEIYSKTQQLLVGKYQKKCDFTVWYQNSDGDQVYKIEKRPTIFDDPTELTTDIDKGV